MIDSFLKPYRLVVQTLSPVHIGSGVKLGRVDFVTEGSAIRVIDENKLINWILRQPNAEKLADKLTNDLKTSGIGEFIKTSFSGNIVEVTAYRLPYAKSPADGSPREIFAFIKTFDHQPYLPGSSLKGSLRSALLRGQAVGDKSRLGQFDKLVNDGAAFGKTNSNEIQSKVFVAANVKSARWPNYDINRILLVRDESLDLSAFSVAKTQILSVKLPNNILGWKQKLKGGSMVDMDVYVEAFKQKEPFRVSISWQTNLFHKLAADLQFGKLESSFAFLPEYCRKTSQDILEQELAFYQRHHHKELTDWYAKKLEMLRKSDDEVFILPLGWGSGYDAKTITDLLETATFQLVTKKHQNTKKLGYPTTNPTKWLGPLDAPKSRKIVVRPDGTLEPMGWVACRFVTDGETDWLTERREALKELRPAVIVSAPAPTASAEPPHPVAIAPAAPTAKPAPPVKPTQKPLITRFTTTPKPGDPFDGEVISVGANEIMLNIPGLEDSEDYAVIDLSGLPIKRPRTGEKVTCEVVAVKKEKNYWRVECRLG